jgi:zinc D-Ala-D-Ala carboxypeptidase
MADLDMALSKDFKLWEFVISPTADRNGVDNTPNKQEIEHLRKLCVEILQPARDALGPLKISSGFRSAKLNTLVKGSRTSDHRLGYAADVKPVNVGTRALAEWVVRNCPKFDQVILEFDTPENPRWIHLSAAPRGRKEVLKASLSASGKTIYTKIKI